MPAETNMPSQENDDVDKAGAVYDWMGKLAEDGDGDWITTSQGKHIELDPETGEPVKGNIGQKNFGYQSQPLTSTGPDSARYNELLAKNDGQHVKAAREYYREKLQGRHVEARTDDGLIQVAFTGSGWNEIKKDMARDAVKAELVPHMPDIIASGLHRAERPIHEHPDVKQFHSFRKVVQTSEGLKEAIVDVAERLDPEPNQAANQVYNLTREGTRTYEVRQKKTASFAGPPGRNRGRQKKPTQDSHAVNGDIIGPTYEVVNVRVE